MIAPLHSRWLLTLTLACVLGSWFVIAPASRATPSVIEHVEVSAPILPRVSVLYAAEGAHFPMTPSDVAALAHSAALTFDYLLSVCPATYPSIVVRGVDDPPTTPEQNASNFEALAMCAYNDFVSKPYWIPALVDQVDICGTELGSSWHLISEDDVNSLSDSDAQQLAAALTTPNADSFFGNMYFSLHVWVRAGDGSLERGDLSPGVTTRLSTLPVAVSSTVHYESDLALRCIRRTTE